MTCDALPPPLQETRQSHSPKLSIGLLSSPQIDKLRVDKLNFSAPADHNSPLGDLAMVLKQLSQETVRVLALCESRLKRDMRETPVDSVQTSARTLRADDANTPSFGPQITSNASDKGGAHLGRGRRRDCAKFMSGGPLDSESNSAEESDLPAGSRQLAGRMRKFRQMTEEVQSPNLRAMLENLCQPLPRKPSVDAQVGDAPHISRQNSTSGRLDAAKCFPLSQSLPLSQPSSFSRAVTEFLPSESKLLRETQDVPSQQPMLTRRATSGISRNTSVHEKLPAEADEANEALSNDASSSQRVLRHSSQPPIDRRLEERSQESPSPPEQNQVAMSHTPVSEIGFNSSFSSAAPTHSGACGPMPNDLVNSSAVSIPAPGTTDGRGPSSPVPATPSSPFANARFARQMNCRKALRGRYMSNESTRELPNMRRDAHVDHEEMLQMKAKTMGALL